MAQNIVIRVDRGRKPSRKAKKKRKKRAKLHAGHQKYRHGVWEVRSHEDVLREEGIEVVHGSAPRSKDRLKSGLKSTHKWLKEQGKAYQERMKEQEKRRKQGKKGLLPRHKW